MVDKKILRNLPDVFRDEYPLSVLLDTLNSGIDDAEDNNTDLSIQIPIETTTGENLDEFAKLFKLSRNTGETDTEFRARIKGYFQSAISFGTEDNIKAAVASALDISESDITITYPSDMRLVISFPIPFGFDEDTLTPTINNTKAAGIYVAVEIEFTQTENIEVTETVNAVQINAFKINESRLNSNNVLG